MLDVITCEGCGRKTYAQLARCPHCGREIDVPYCNLNLPPEYVEVDDNEVRIYPVRWRLLNTAILLFLVAVIMAFGLTILIFEASKYGFDNIQFTDSKFKNYFVLIGSPFVFAILIFAFIQNILAYIRKVPILIVNKDEVIFPIDIGSFINRKNISSIDIQSTFHSKQLVFKIDPPAPVLRNRRWARRFLERPRRELRVAVTGRWPIGADQVRELIDFVDQKSPANRHGGTANQ